VKIRIGFGLGTRSFTNRPETFDPFVDALEELRFDSLWLSERVSGEAPDPVVGMAYAAGRTTRLKFGTSVMVLPGRNPVLVAKELASLDRLSNGRLLPAFGLGAVDPREQQAFGVERGERARLFDEALPLIRRLWEEEVVDHSGEHYRFEGVSVLPQPTQKPLDVWLGGQAPSELRRVGRLGDGWLPSFCDADDVADGRVLVEAEAERVGRQIDPEHFGALVAYRRGSLPDEVLAFVGRRRPDKDPADLLPEGLPALRARLEQLVEVGASKFVVLRLGEPDDWGDELAEVAAELLPLEN
jgi:probable F420-dependent oxidoreductase